MTATQAIWGGSRVRLIESHEDIPGGTEGVNKGRRRDGTTLVRLDNGRTEYLPINLLVRIDQKEVRADDISTWNDKIPPVMEGARVNRTIQRGATDTYRYELRGASTRWFIVRIPKNGGGGPKRSKFFANQRLATAAFEEIVY
ncbi:hypothetical protein [Actinomadura oligospora]|uniref:hypothetical protein n=1 Tax=Actinomadura oligospora TaxID=111804 RepID=UPI0012F7555F|nr:hypothetical protein [Actinomadura oligospora]